MRYTKHVKLYIIEKNGKQRKNKISGYNTEFLENIYIFKHLLNPVLIQKIKVA